MRKIFLLNGGRDTRQAFQSGIQRHLFTHLRTKETILHVTPHLDIKCVHGNSEVDFTDSYVFTRLRGNDVHFIGILYEHLAAKNVPTSDPISLSYQYSEAKISQAPRFARAGIPTPETIIAREESYRRNRDYIHAHMVYPLVYKTNGSRGRNVHLVHSELELETLIQQNKAGQLFIIQAYVPNTFDTRSIIVYGKYLGTIKREAKHGEFRNNVSFGARVSKYELTDKERMLAIEATKVNRLDFGGVDMFHTETGPVVIEVNKSPQIQGFELVYGKGYVFSNIGKMIDDSSWV